ncbi:MAG: DUF2393 domain-containing protein [Sulfurimonas sp.]|uniref:DUF2393 family protein n=1 Tax=Sulfurimonas sp. TaxID=2022749 RepID=UPI0026253028|nr:DUF2393 family protein [Sulfurimonas sp.]MCW8895633.1 DUF2393 domain-containing protein [Sulfurimonas sp.]MCW8954566.1 DUF2393 domain-containing protein [Sulfurimonas sp.]MCW9067947.1 DUF2393 domain-containing protein [Sulfurimonas sp.]
MSTLFNIWHYISLSVILSIFILFLLIALREDNRKLVVQIIISAFLVCVVIAGFAIAAVDKYTKKAGLYKLENKRILSIEKIAYSGVVKNEGNYEIGEVTFEIKLVNKGHATGNVRAGSFFKPSGFFDFFSGGSNRSDKPQQITKEFVVAKNLKPGEAKAFKVYFDYPPYFKSVSHFAKIYAH